MNNLKERVQKNREIFNKDTSPKCINEYQNMNLDWLNMLKTAATNSKFVYKL